jgi:hypothetical protein
MQVDQQSARKTGTSSPSSDDFTTHPTSSAAMADGDVTVRKATNVTDMITQLAVSPHVGDVTESRQRHDEIRQSSTLDERRSTALRHMQGRIELRQKEWDLQVNRMKSDFFQRPMWSAPSGAISDASRDKTRKIIDETTVVVQQPSTTLNAMHTKMNAQPPTTSAPEFRVSNFDDLQLIVKSFTISSTSFLELDLKGSYKTTNFSAFFKGVAK